MLKHTRRAFARLLTLALLLSVAACSNIGNVSSTQNGGSPVVATESVKSKKWIPSEQDKTLMEKFTLDPLYAETRHLSDEEIGEIIEGMKERGYVDIKLSNGDFSESIDIDELSLELNGGELLGTADYFSVAPYCDSPDGKSPHITAKTPNGLNCDIWLNLLAEGNYLEQLGSTAIIKYGYFDFPLSQYTKATVGFPIRYDAQRGVKNIMYSLARFFVFAARYADYSNNLSWAVSEKDCTLPYWIAERLLRDDNSTHDYIAWLKSYTSNSYISWAVQNEKIYAYKLDDETYSLGNDSGKRIEETWESDGIDALASAMRERGYIDVTIEERAPADVFLNYNVQTIISGARDNGNCVLIEASTPGGERISLYLDLVETLRSKTSYNGNDMSDWKILGYGIVYDAPLKVGRLSWSDEQQRLYETKSYWTVDDSSSIEGRDYEYRQYMPGNYKEVWDIIDNYYFCYASLAKATAGGDAKP